MPAPFLPILKLHDWPENCRPSKIWASLWGLPILEWCLPHSGVTFSPKTRIIFQTLSRWPNEPTCAEACVESTSFPGSLRGKSLGTRLALSWSSSNPYASRCKFFNASRQKLIASHLYTRETCDFLRLVTLRKSVRNFRWLAGAFGQRLCRRYMSRMQEPLLARGTPGDLCSSGKRSKGKISGTQVRVCFYKTKIKILTSWEVAVWGLQDSFPSPWHGLWLG